ncbi:MAG: cell division protein ZapA [Bdellovibrionota bacterium]
MTQKKSVEVTVGQQRLSLKTDQDPALVHRVADLVNRRLGEIVPPSQPISHQVLLLLAMNLAQDLLRMEEEGVKLKTEVRSRSQAILTQLEREFPV